MSLGPFVTDLTTQEYKTCDRLLVRLYNSEVVIIMILT